MDEVFFAVEGITKTYPGVVALDDVSIQFEKAEVHALLGENGAGKSTLIKAISGAIKADSGTLRLAGLGYSFLSPLQAKKLGIEVIYQEFNLVESLSAAENIFLGEKFGRQFSRKIIEDKARELFARFHVDINPAAEVESLSPAKKQIVEICKAIAKDVKLLIMDEPSAPLSTTEVEILFDIVASLKRRGVTIIYITHRMDEVFRISDRVTVLRDGRYISTGKTKDTTREELVSLMVGREFKETYPARSDSFGEVALDVRRLTGNGNKDISLFVRKGEILGLAGLVGSGRTEFANVLFGAAPKESGEISVNGKPVKIRSPKDAIANGIGLIPEDRKALGCLQEQSVQFNISIQNIRQVCGFFQVNAKKDRSLAEKFRDKLRIKTPTLSQEVQFLSGGNQQKVVLAKALAANLDILIFDEPTRGIDVGAKSEIYELMTELSAQGKAIIMISSDMEELLGMSDRVMVFYAGKCVGEVERNEFDAKKILTLASGITEEAA
ncbi:ribose import ATP-binding protein RbsA [Spirochaetia bacterium]|nr:ribose import ATP-binding protein RbsA [Spirochaetia bacterium]